MSVKNSEKGQWKKGRSGNSKGRPKGIPNLVREDTSMPNPTGKGGFVKGNTNGRRPAVPNPTGHNGVLANSKQGSESSSRQVYSDLSPDALKEKNKKEIWDSFYKDLGKRSGCDLKSFGRMVTSQLRYLFSDPNCDKQSPESLAFMGLMMEHINPRDPIEGMLAVQIIATHYAVANCLLRSHLAQSMSIEHAQSLLNSAVKLSRTFTMQMEALNRHRGKGQQKMTVEHVHINAGGQAIIGNVQSGGHKKREAGVKK